MWNGQKDNKFDYYRFLKNLSVIERKQVNFEGFSMISEDCQMIIKDY